MCFRERTKYIITTYLEEIQLLTYLKYLYFLDFLSKFSFE